AAGARAVDVAGTERAHVRHRRREARRLVLRARRGEPLARRGGEAALPAAVRARADDVRAPRRVRVLRIGAAGRRVRRALPGPGPAVPRRARVARALPRRALLSLHGRRRALVPRRYPPSAVGSPARRRRDLPQHLVTRAPARRGSARALLASAGHGRLDAERGLMTPQKRAALTSVAAAAALVVLKLSVGLATHSLGLVSEAVHSGTDLVAALLTFFAVRVSARPA